MTNHAQSKPETAPRELTIAEMRQAGGGKDHDRWTELQPFSFGTRKAGGGA